MTMETIQPGAVAVKSAEDRLLLAEVSRWAHANGWTDGGWRGFMNARYSDDATVVVRPHECGFDVWRKEPGERVPGRPMEYPADSVRQAVDLLVALDILPARFARAYKVGVASAQPTNPDRRCCRCGATSGLKMLHRSPLALAANEWQCWDNCRDSAR